MAGPIRALGVPDALAERFWSVAKDNITVKADLAQWWMLFTEGAEPLVDPEDEVFVAEALALLPPRPWTEATWGEWTSAVKDATGRKGKALFRPLRRALTGRDAGPEMTDVMPLLQKLRIEA
jgi:glutamyl-tRNA synthetase